MYAFVKRAIDILGAGIGLIVLSPILLSVSFAIWMKMGRTVIFRQQRPGIYGKPFYIFKFRTMTNDVDDNGKLLPDDQRLTRLGDFLRRSSFDEFPELLNVVRGEMSLVGPRPLRMSYLEFYSDEQARRHDVLPGITGWAQINGRNAITWEEKFALDVWYVDNCSLLLDIRILLSTFIKVIKREGISAEGSVTMPSFSGNMITTTTDVVKEETNK